MKIIDAEILVAKGFEHARSVLGVDLDEWSFEFNNSRRCLGVCNYSKKTIYLSRAFTEVNTPEMVWDTIIHEIAHAVCPGAKHGPIWVNTYRQLGGKNGTKARAGVDTNLVEPKWVVVDPTTNKIVSRYQRKPSKCFKNSYIPGRKEETLGKLVAMPYAKFKRSVSENV